MTTDLKRSRDKNASGAFLLWGLALANGDEIRAGQFVPFGPDVTPPRRLSGAIPVYPSAALERGLEGSPVVDIWIDEKGNVMDVAILESAGAMLDGAVSPGFPVQVRHGSADPRRIVSATRRRSAAPPAGGSHGGSPHTQPGSTVSSG